MELVCLIEPNLLTCYRVKDSGWTNIGQRHRVITIPANFRVTQCRILLDSTTVGAFKGLLPGATKSDPSVKITHVFNFSLLELIYQIWRQNPKELATVEQGCLATVFGLQNTTKEYPAWPTGGI